eukprot:c21893_g2_i1.p1 GENE.c21893_g2_i1~~c21893_g2_i1.p1  ORF type:complete len:968 (+),score=341.22 c21893_g2_i1:11-2914(+)
MVQVSGKGDVAVAKAVEIIQENQEKELILNGCKIGPKGVQTICPLLNNNTSINNLQLRWCSVGDEGAIYLSEVLKQNKTIKTLSLHSNEITAKGIASLAQGLKSNSSLTHLDLELNQIGQGVQHLVEPLKTNKSLRELILYGNYITDKGVPYINQILESNTSLLYLDLDVNEISDSGGKSIAASVKKNDIITTLNLGKNPLIAETTLDIIRKKLSINLGLQSLYKFGQVKFSRPKLYFCGKEGSGKTTLRKSLQRSLFQRIFTTEQVQADPDKIDERTEGVEVESGKLRNGGEFSFWDFAGQSEYYITHEMFLSTIEGIFIVFCDLSKPQDQRFNDSWYWLKFIKTRFAPNKKNNQNNKTDKDTNDFKPFVVIVGSHRDRCIDSTEVLKIKSGAWKCAWGDSFIEEAKEHFEKYLCIQDTFFVLNCQSSNSFVMDQLRHCLSHLHIIISSRSPKVPKLCEHSLSFIPQIRRTYSTGIEKSVFINLLSKELHITFTDEISLALLRYLQYIGEIVWFEEIEQLKDLLFIDTNWLCQNVIGKALAPKSFHEHTLLAYSNDGIVKKSNIRKIFSSEMNQDDNDVIIQLLQNLNLCFPKSQNENEKESELCFMFPTLLGLKNENANAFTTWNKLRSSLSSDNQCYGRRLVVNNKVDMFSAGFFPKLQVRCQKLFGQYFELWKNQIFGNLKGIHTLIQLHEQEGSESWLDVWIRSELEDTPKSLSLLEKIMDEIELNRMESCAGTETKVYVLSHSDLRNSSDITAGSLVFGYELDLVQNSDPNEKLLPTHPKATADHQAEKPKDLLGLNFHNPSDNNNSSIEDGKGMVMLSYNWGSRNKNNIYPNQEKVKLVRQKLEEKGYKCWMDLQGMGYEMDKTMMNVIRNCDGFIACVTNEYQKPDTNANKEFLFAVTQKKKIFGLKMDVDTDMLNQCYAFHIPPSAYKYYDISDESNFNKAIDDLIKDMNQRQVYPTK